MHPSERLFVRLAEDPAYGPESGTPPGTVRALALPPALRGAVSQLLVCRETVPPGQRIQERVLPDGAVRVVFDLLQPSALVLGASSEAALVSMQGHTEGISLALRPGAVAEVLGADAAELAGRRVDLRDLWPDVHDALTEQLVLADSDAARATLLYSVLLRRRRERPAAKLAMQAAERIARSAGHFSVQQIAAELGVGERRLQQLFQAHVGLRPRAWIRLSRVHACVRALRDRRPPRWADLALEHGFFDQAHMANEFRALCGLSPSAYWRVVSGSSKTAARAPAT